MVAEKGAVLTPEIKVEHMNTLLRLFALGSSDTSKIHTSCSLAFGSDWKIGRTEKIGTRSCSKGTFSLTDKANTAKGFECPMNEVFSEFDRT